MPLTIPEAQALDGRLHASDDDANVSVWPYTRGGEYRTNQAGVNPRAATTITVAPGTEAQTVVVTWNGVWYFIPFNTSVTVPAMVYQLLTVAGSPYTVT